jgi:hypothetical protein
LLLIEALLLFFIPPAHVIMFPYSREAHSIHECMHLASRKKHLGLQFMYVMKQYISIPTIYPMTYQE